MVAAIVRPRTGFGRRIGHAGVNGSRAGRIGLPIVSGSPELFAPIADTRRW